jgi:hypothetical protein
MSKQSYQQALRAFEEKIERRRLERAGRLKEAKVYEFPDKLSEQELMRRQRVVDATWERVLAEKRELELEAERSCHRSPLDSDADLSIDPFWPRRR